MHYNFNSLSVSKLNTFISCPQKFYLHYILKVPDEFTPDFFKIGRCLHKILECINLDIQKGILLHESSYADLIEEKIKEYKVGNNFILTFPLYVAEYLSKIRPLILDSNSFVIGVEKEFKIPLKFKEKEYTFRGVIDLVVFNSDGSQIFDFKTKARNQEDTELMLTRDLQVQMYSYLVHTYGKILRGQTPELTFEGEGVPVSRYGHIQFTFKDNQVYFKYNKIFHYSEILDRVGYWVEKIEDCIKTGYFPRNPSFCSYCEKKSVCLGKTAINKEKKYLDN